MIDGIEVPNSAAIYAYAPSLRYERPFDELSNLSASLPKFENTTRSAQAFESMSCDDSKISVGIIWSTLAAAATHRITWSFTEPGILRLISHLHLGAEYLLNVGLNDKQNRPERYSLIYLLWTMAMNRVSISRNSFVQPLITRRSTRYDRTGPT